MGPLAWHPIGAAEAHVRFDDLQRVGTRRAAVIKGRYIESVTLGRGGVLTYEQVLDKQVYFSANQDMPLDGQTRSPFLRERQVVFNPAAIRSAGRLEYLVAQTPKATCFVYRGTFGAVPLHPDQLVYGNSCFGPSKPAASLEREMLAILATARFPDGYGNELTLDIPPSP